MAGNICHDRPGPGGCEFWSGCRSNENEVLKMRLFIALCPEASAVSKLLEVIDKWKAEGMKGNFTKVQNIHLTLAFLGEQPEAKLPIIRQVLKSIPFPKLSLQANGIGHFGSLYYAHIEPSAVLAGYVEQVRQALKEAGVEFDAKPFKAHITLCRKLCNPNQYPLELEPFEFSIETCCLFQSVLTPQGPVYTVLEMA